MLGNRSISRLCQGLFFLLLLGVTLTGCGDGRDVCSQGVQLVRRITGIPDNLNSAKKEPEGTAEFELIIDAGECKWILYGEDLSGTLTLRVE